MFYWAWVEDLVQQSVESMAGEYRARGKGDYVRVFYGRLCQGLSIAEVARALDLPQSAVDHYFRDARDRLAGVIEEKARTQLQRYCAAEDAAEEFTQEWQQLRDHLSRHGGLENAVRRNTPWECSTATSRRRISCWNKAPAGRCWPTLGSSKRLAAWPATSKASTLRRKTPAGWRRTGRTTSWPWEGSAVKSSRVRPPFPADAQAVEPRSLSDVAAPSSDCLETVRRVVARLAATEPENRYRTAAEARADLTGRNPDGCAASASDLPGSLSEPPETAAGPLCAPSLRLLSRRTIACLLLSAATGTRAVPWIAGALLLMLIAIGLGYRWHGPTKPTRPTEPIQATLEPTTPLPSTAAIKTVTPPAASSQSRASKGVVAKRLPSGPLEDPAVFPASTIRAFGGQPPPYCLSFAGRQSVECGPCWVAPDWIARAFTVFLVVKLSYRDTPCRLMGNLDTRPGREAQAGWALLQIPAQTAGETDLAAGAAPNAGPQPEPPLDRTIPSQATAVVKGLSRLALLYRSSDGGLRQIVGPPFEPGDPWRRIVVSSPWSGAQVAVRLDAARYLEQPPDRCSASRREQGSG